MKTPLILLVTNDGQLENLVADALLQTAGVSHLVHDPGDALETACTVQDLDLAIIDFEHSPHRLALLNAINSCREDLPLIAIICDNDKHLEALAYANGATACFAKPVLTMHLAEAVRELCRRKREPAFA